jgi:RNA polymerase sigma-70 factor (ECF subfamily)
LSTPLDLIKDAVRGDTRAFRALVEIHQGLVYAVAFRFVRNAQDAEDITQDVFVRLWRHIGKYRHEESKLSTWLYKITTNCCLDFTKSRHTRAERSAMDIDEVNEIPSVNTAERDLHQRELNALVLKAAHTLAPKQRMVFILRDLEGLSPEEVGQALDMSAANVKSNLCHARQKIASILKPLTYGKPRLP